MALSDIVIPTRTIEAGSASFEVRGLCYRDITDLMMSFKVELDELVTGYLDAADQPEGEAPDLFDPMELLNKSPRLFARLIALAADEPNQDEIAAKLSIGVQVEALAAIYELTVDQAGGLEKLVGTVIAAFRGIRPLMEMASNRLDTGTAALQA